MPEAIELVKAKEHFGLPQPADGWSRDIAKNKAAFLLDTESGSLV
jgi:hypothetical protein